MAGCDVAAAIDSHRRRGAPVAFECRSALHGVSTAAGVRAIEDKCSAPDGCRACVRIVRSGNRERACAAFDQRARTGNDTSKTLVLRCVYDQLAAGC